MSILEAILSALVTLIIGSSLAAVVVLAVVYIAPWAGVAALLLITLGLITALNVVSGQRHD